MTTNGRGFDSENDAIPDKTGPDESSSQAPSGVFPTSTASVEPKRKDSGWTIAGQFVREGFSYRVMRRPLEFAPAPPRLTKREEAAVALACLGHTNKSIAQVMSVSPSTVGVLLFRVAGKFNAKSRSELLSNYEQFKAAVSLEAASDDDREPTK
jgi:DNA-binding CsgD family transcriptional regulator